MAMCPITMGLLGEPELVEEGGLAEIEELDQERMLRDVPHKVGHET